MGIIKEFKEFAIKGNMIDMAVGIIIGTAFNKIVDVLVKQIVLPPLSIITSGISFSDKKIVLRDGIASTGPGIDEIKEIAMGYGAFLEAILDFLIVGFTIFLVIKFMNRFRRKAQDPKNKTVETPKDIQLLSDLTELIREQNQLLKNGTGKS
jgi:large conductance mechanosensitive channel